ncbi:MAG: alpha/beta fold hydrolase [Acidobacteriota bacterium]
MRIARGPASLIAISAMSVIAAAGAIAGPSLDGAWVGGLELGGRWSLAAAEFKTEADEVKGVLRLPFDNAGGLVGEVASEEPALRFEVALGAAKLSFEGRADAAVIRGTIRRSDESGSLVLHRQLEPALLDPCTGLYQSGDRLLWIQRWGEAGDLLVCVDEAGSIRALFPSGITTFVVGPAFLRCVPETATIQFVRTNEGRVAGLRVLSEGKPEESYDRVDLYAQEEIAFRNGEVPLAGTLFTPRSRGPHPVLVLVHGSGSQDRLSGLVFVSALLRKGIALFCYDKRGVGKSGGNWLQAGFEDLAGDAAAAAALLKKRPDINPEQIGVWGISQGGWIAPLAASLSSDFSFVVIVAGPAVTPEQQELIRVEGEMRAGGFSEEDVRESLDLYELMNRYVRTGEGWDDFIAAREEATKKPWGPPPGSIRSEDDPYFAFWKLIMRYDPVPVLEKIRCPFLAMFGELDTNVQPRVNRPIMEAALKRAGNRDYTILVFPTANHVLFEAESGRMSDFVEARRFVPEYLSTLTEWLQKRVRLP